MKHLQHALDLPLRHQGCRVVRSEPFFDEEICPRERSPLISQILRRHHAPFQRRPTRQALAQPQPRALDLV